MTQGIITKVTGPLVIAKGMRNANMFDVVRVSKQELIGEIIEIHGDKASIQVYEETTGLGPGEPVVSTGEPLSVELGPGLLEKMFDGIQRPLEKIREMVGSNITKGINIPALDHEKKWDFVPTIETGSQVSSGDIIGTVEETVLIQHKIMIPYGISGEIVEINSGQYNVTETIAKLKKANGDVIDVKMLQKWPVRRGRPYNRKLPPNEPLVTGQRAIDTLFPVVKGGVAAVPGPFGSGKTVCQHQLAKWSNTEIVVYIGCGERGNEMTDVLVEFPEIIDPKSGESLMKRTVLIANTSDMPVAAREASIYTGMTIAEYYRDMGYSVALMADSTSRWAEALREMSGRLEEMPGEEGYPAYLSSRIAQFYERAGRVENLGNDGREGTLTAIGAVSPPGGDLSEPVTQATLRIVKVFWGLDATLAHKRHYPAINWLESYSLYGDILENWYSENVAMDRNKFKNDAMTLLQKESELQEIVRLVGIDSLSPTDVLTLETACTIREDYLQQDAFDDIDTYSSMDKQYKLLKLIMTYYNKSLKAIESGANSKKLFKLPIREDIGRFKYIPENEIQDEFIKLETALNIQIDEVISGGGSND